MQIAEVEAIPVSMRLTPLEDGGISPYVTNHGHVDEVERVLVRVETDTGVTGWGEMRVFLSPRATVGVIEEGIAPIVRGRSPFELESLRRLFFIEYTNVDMFFAPIEVACWDIVGQVLERPIFELLGGWTAPAVTERRRDASYGEDQALDIAYCLGILSPEESRAHAATAREEGYRVLKTKAGRDWKEDVERVVAMHDEVDGELEFRLDPNQGWRPDEAVRLCAQLADRGVYLQYAEQPIRVDAHESLASLHGRVTQPIAPNEDTYSRHNLRSLVANGSIDAAVVDLTPAGGISGVRELAAIAEDGGVPVAHHCAFDLGVRTAAIVHTVFGTPGFTLPPDSAYAAWEDDIISEPLTVRNGQLVVPDGPGLGVTVDHEKLERYRID